MIRQKPQTGASADPCDEMVYLHYRDGAEQIVPMAGLKRGYTWSDHGKADAVVVFHESRPVSEVRHFARRVESRLVQGKSAPELFTRTGGVEGELDWREAPALRVSEALAELELAMDEVMLLPGDWLEQWLEPKSGESTGSLAEWLGGDGRDDNSACESAMERLLRERENIIRTVPMLDAEELARLRGSQASQHRALAKRWRDSGELLGVKVGREFRYPEFQFDPRSGQLRPQMAHILALLHAGEDDADGWRAMHWFYARAGTLYGERPFELFPDEPERVLTAACMEFGGNGDADQVSSSAATR